ncbi:hypothetical protein KR009_009862 [Drosophila setifemur]|nr:hypothetical protein KR009_009862 [Drosophila setifemur]
MLETKSIAALAFAETPRKRKRETQHSSNHNNNAASPPPPQPQQQLQPLEKDARMSQKDAAVASKSCFTNAAFSSTPKKLLGRRRLAKENSNPFPGLEVKSIAALAEKQQRQREREQEQDQPLPTNPFEVLRHPCKKKKREHGCFENPGLNLELPEKQFNPYEVIRSLATPAKGFVNPALNLRGTDAPASLNPFEIHRPSEASTLACNPAGVENAALAEREPEEEALPTSLKIGLPFTPTLGCRIDFHGLSLAQLTPSKLLAEKLVFSPVPAPVSAPKRSLGAISEESSMDIGKELDRYQLELENSINEAKLRKNGCPAEKVTPRNSPEMELAKRTPQMELPKVSLVVVESNTQEVMMMQDVGCNGEQLERRLVCSRRRTLTEIREEQQEEEQLPEDSEMLEKQQLLEEKQQQLEREKMEKEQQLEREKMEMEQQLERERKEKEQQLVKEKEQHLEKERLQERLHEQLKAKLKEREKELLEREKLLEDKERLLEEQAHEAREDVAYASESDEEPDLDMDFKAPARFVRAYRPAASTTSKESLHSIGSSKSSKSAEAKPSGGGMKNMIRKSIRRLMHPHTSPEKVSEEEAPTQGHHNIISSIRHSLRRRPQKMVEEVEADLEPALPDISIIDSSERTMKLRSNVPQTEYMTIDQLTNEKKHSLRNSIRRSTRDVLRHVFHKSHDAYATAK